MPRISVTVSNETFRKIHYVMKNITHDRSASSLVNKSVLLYLAKYNDPPEEDQPELEF